MGWECAWKKFWTIFQPVSYFVFDVKIILGQLKIKFSFDEVHHRLLIMVGEWLSSRLYHRPNEDGRGKSGHFLKKNFYIDIRRQTRQCSVKHKRLRGENAMVLPADCPKSVGSYMQQETAEGKLKFPPFPGAGAVVTKDRCIRRGRAHAK